LVGLRETRHGHSVDIAGRTVLALIVWMLGRIWLHVLET
jgi:hypothetical protein